MLKYAVVVLALIWGLAPSIVLAQAGPQKTVVISTALAEEIFQHLSTNGILGMLQNEIQHQPAPVTCPEAKAPETKPTEEPSK